MMGTRCVYYTMKPWQEEGASVPREETLLMVPELSLAVPPIPQVCHNNLLQLQLQVSSPIAGRHTLRLLPQPRLLKLT